VRVSSWGSHDASPGPSFALSHGVGNLAFVQDSKRSPGRARRNPGPAATSSDPGFRCAQSHRVGLAPPDHKGFDRIFAASDAATPRSTVHARLAGAAG
jgi:hypothetical protein